MQFIAGIAQAISMASFAWYGMSCFVYPIPSTARRLRQLEKASPRFVPGNLARSNLYYSWATLTLLGRAVHCNVGRPALWVFPPSA